MAVARSEFTWETPAFANSAVREAKSAESKAYTHHIAFFLRH
jgi:hypothetical protein